MTTSDILASQYLAPNDGNKPRVFERLIYDLRRQFPDWPSTFSACQTHGCTDAARGGGCCAGCLTEMIGELTGQPSLANRLHDSLERSATLTHDLRESLTPGTPEPRSPSGVFA